MIYSSFINNYSTHWCRSGQGYMIPPMFNSNWISMRVNPPFFFIIVKWSLKITSLSVQICINIIQIHNNVLWDWKHSTKYSPHSRIFHGILSVPQNIVMWCRTNIQHKLKATLHLEARPIRLEANCIKSQPFLGWRPASTTHSIKIIMRANFPICKGLRAKKWDQFNKSSIIQRS